MQNFWLWAVKLQVEEVKIKANKNKGPSAFVPDLNEGVKRSPDAIEAPMRGGCDGNWACLFRAGAIRHK